MKTLKILALVSLVSMSVFASSGEHIYKKCAACHGTMGEKHALNKSRVVADMNVTELSNALHGYKKGSYGGAMKALMRSQIATLSDEDIEKVSEYISKIKNESDN